MKTSRMRNALILILSIFLSAQAFAQSPSWQPDRYFGISDRDKVLVFTDEFEDNSNHWLTDNRHSREAISDEGEYSIETLPGKQYANRKRVEINPHGNFEVELRIRFTRGPQNQAISLIFGGDGRGKEYRIQLFPGKAFNLVRHNKGKSTPIQDRRDSPVVQKYAYNAVMLRRVGPLWHLFINHEYLGSLASRPLYGKYVGIAVGAGQRVEVDYIRVAQLEEADFFGPQISITSPRPSQSGMLSFENGRPRIAGTVTDPSGVRSFTINNQPVDLQPDGSFVHNPDLRTGYSSIYTEATDEYHNRSKISYYTVFRPEPVITVREAEPRPLPTTVLSRTTIPQQASGKNYLLLIGIDKYSRWELLHNAVKDCEDIARVLAREYTFESENIFRVYNADATRENILETFEILQKRVSSDDNLLLYFAGHGYYDKYSTLGYWVAVNSRQNKIPDFIRNSTVQDYIKTINAHHTLLIADACYAGSLFSSSRGIYDVNNKSRWAFTSGDIERVWDGKPGNNSPFAHSLIMFLHNQRNAYVKADELIKAVSGMVSRNTDQTPVGSPLQNVGDQGGVFVFFRK